MSRTVAEWSKVSCLGSVLLDSRCFESPCGNKFSQGILASVCDRCQPSIVRHLGSYDRYRILVARTGYNGWWIRRANHMSPLYWPHDRPLLCLRTYLCGREANSRLVTQGSSRAVAKDLFIYLFIYLFITQIHPYNNSTDRLLDFYFFF